MEANPVCTGSAIRALNNLKMVLLKAHLWMLLDEWAVGVATGVDLLIKVTFVRYISASL